MALGIYHIHGTASGIGGAHAESVAIGVCADGKTEAAQIVRRRILNDGYDNWSQSSCERICAPGEWEPGATLRYS